MWKTITMNTSNSINFEATVRELWGPYRMGITLFEMLISSESSCIKQCKELVDVLNLYV